MTGWTRHSTAHAPSCLPWPGPETHLGSSFQAGKCRPPAVPSLPHSPLPSFPALAPVPASCSLSSLFLSPPIPSLPTLPCPPPLQAAPPCTLGAAPAVTMSVCPHPRVGCCRRGRAGRAVRGAVCRHCPRLPCLRPQAAEPQPQVCALPWSPPHDPRSVTSPLHWALLPPLAPGPLSEQARAAGPPP